MDLLDCKRKFDTFHKVVKNDQLLKESLVVIFKTLKFPRNPE